MQERRSLVLPRTLNFRDFLAFRREQRFLRVARQSSDVEDRWIQCSFSMRTEKRKTVETRNRQPQPAPSSSISHLSGYQAPLPESIQSSEATETITTHTETVITQLSPQSTAGQHILQQQPSGKDSLCISDPSTAPVVPFVAPDLPAGSLEAFPHFP